MVVRIENKMKIIFPVVNIILILYDNIITILYIIVEVLADCSIVTKCVTACQNLAEFAN